jgi:capsular polysaccharide biosynthesis protein
MVSAESETSIWRLPSSGGDELPAPLLSLGEAGEELPLPYRLPPGGSRSHFIATLPHGVVAVMPEIDRTYLLDRDGQLVLEALEDSPYVHARAMRDREELATLERRPRRDGEQVAVLGGQRGAYWHWWIDVLSRAWLLERYGASTAALPLVLPRAQVSANEESLRLLGLSERLAPLDPGLHEFERVAFCSPGCGSRSRLPSARVAEYAGWLRDRLYANGEGRGERRLFISRADASCRRIVNEEATMELLAEHGFERLECGRMTIREQAAAFAEASIVVGPHGAGLTNLLFTPPGATTIELFASPAAIEVSNYRVLCARLGHRYVRLLAAPVAGPRTKATHQLDMQVDLALLQRALTTVAV